MIRKSVTAFILGLVGSLFSLWWGFISGIGGGLVDGILASSGAAFTEATLINLLGWLAFLGAIVGFVGAANCLKKARRGGILLTVATVMCSPIQLYFFIKIIGYTTAMFTTIFIIFLLPVVLLVVATVLAYCAKLVDAPADPMMQQTYTQSQPVQYTQPQPQANSLENELTNLKGMLDKGLLTEEEYNEAKKNAIAKHTK